MSSWRASVGTDAKLKRIHAVIPEDLVAEIDALVGERRRSRFIAEVVAEELRRRRLKAALAKMDGALADVDIPGWETPEAARAWVNAIREGAEASPPSDSAA
jgi:hypothetical protein